MVENILLQNVETKTTLALSKVLTQDFILDEVDWGIVSSTHHSYKYVNQTGVYVTNTNLETRDISITGWVVAQNEIQMTRRKTILNRFFNPKQPIDLFYKDYKLRFLSSASIRYSTAIAENNEVICKFKIDGFCPDPMFKNNLENRVTAATVVGMFHFPLITSTSPNPPGGAIFGEKKASLIVGVVNGGATPVGMRIVFKANGVVVNPSLVDVNTQKFFKVNKTMERGEVIEVNTVVGEKKIVGTLSGLSSNYFKFRDLDSEWLQLSVGENLFRYDADAGLGSLEVYVYFYTKFLEVQECF